MKEGGEEKNEQNHKLRRGLWTEEEDRVLSEHIRVHGGGRWNRIPKITGLKRCGKSCRLRWLNYLSPTVKRGDFSHEEEDLIIRLHKLLGNRWSLIAGRVPGRTDNQVKNHWNTHLSKRLGMIKKQNLNNKRLIKQLSTVDDACSSPHHHQPAADDHDDQINRPSSSTVSNSTSTFSADHQQDMRNKDKLDNNNLEQHSPDDDDDQADHVNDHVDHEDDDDPLMTSRISSVETTTYSSCYDDPDDSLLLSSTRHSHHLNFFEFFDSPTFDMNRL